MDNKTLQRANDIKARIDQLRVEEASLRHIGTVVDNESQLPTT